MTFSIEIRAATHEECSGLDGVANPGDGACSVLLDGQLVAVLDDHGHVVAGTAHSDRIAVLAAEALAVYELHLAPPGADSE